MQPSRRPTVGISFSLLFLFFLCRGAVAAAPLQSCTLRWKQVHLATRYLLQVRNQAGKQVVRRFTRQNSVQLRLAPGTYQARLTVYNKFSKPETRSKWFAFTVTMPLLARPRFSPAPGTYSEPVAVTISSTNQGADYLWSTNQGATWYTGSNVTLAASTILLAKASNAGWKTSTVARGEYVITGRVAAPVFDPAPGTLAQPGSVRFSSTTPGASVFWSTNQGRSWQGGDSLRVEYSLELWAKATKAEWKDSFVSKGNYRLLQTVATPGIFPPSGKYTTALLEVRFTCATPGANLEWSTNQGATWQAGSSLQLRTNALVWARARKQGWQTSLPAQAAYQVSPPAEKKPPRRTPPRTTPSPGAALAHLGRVHISAGIGFSMIMKPWSDLVHGGIAPLSLRVDWGLLGSRDHCLGLLLDAAVGRFPEKEETNNFYVSMENRTLGLGLFYALRLGRGAALVFSALGGIADSEVYVTQGNNKYQQQSGDGFMQLGTGLRLLLFDPLFVEPGVFYRSIFNSGGGIESVTIFLRLGVQL